MANSDLLSQLLSGSSLGAISSAAGTQKDETQDVLSSVLPMLLGGMQKNASTSSGAASLSKALDDHAAAKTTTAKVDVSDGSKIVSHVLGADTAKVTKSVANKTGVSQSQVSSIMAAAAPMLMSMLGTQKKSSNSDVSSLLSSAASAFGGDLNLSSLISMATKDEDGDGQSDLLESLGGLFGGKK